MVLVSNVLHIKSQKLLQQVLVENVKRLDAILMVMNMLPEKEHA